MSDITTAVEQQEVADSILDAPIVGSHSDPNFGMGEADESNGAETATEESFREPQEHTPQERAEAQPQQETEQPATTGSPQEVTPQDVDVAIQQMDQAIEQWGLNDPSQAQQLAYELTAPFGVDPSGCDAKALGGVMSKVVFSAAQTLDQFHGNLNGLGPIAPAAAARFTSDFLSSFGIDPRTTQIDSQRFANVVLAGTMNFMQAVQAHGVNASIDRLNSAEAAEWFANELHRCFGQNEPVDRAHALQIADAGGRYILGAMQRMAQVQAQLKAAQPSGGRRAQKRAQEPAWPSAPRNGRTRWTSNQDLFDADTMSLWEREHGRL